MKDMPRYGNLDALLLKWILATPEQKKNFKPIIENHPTVDVIPRSEGEWIKVDDGVLIGDGKHLECSECGVWGENMSNFCSHCGAKMKGGEE